MIDFVFQEQPAGRKLSSFVEAFAHTSVEQGGAFTAEAATHWEMIVVRSNQQTYLMIRGSETQATLANCPANSEFTIIRFRAGIFMPHLPMEQLVDREVITQAAGRDSFWLDGAVYQYPEFSNAEAFVEKLIQNGVLVEDAWVTRALSNKSPAISQRHLQRRFRASTGMSQNKIRQINRTEKIASMLANGISIPDAIHLGEYTDQSHLTRALKYYRGRTPARLIADA